uniref:Interferon related developmental regulator 2 n=1 Tax=Otus sunia TaxID=257818 RepID=A0A8C8AJ59_9STRI
MDNLLDKSAKTRQAALQSLRLAFSSKTLSEFLLERRLMLTDSLERCLKKGKGEEQALAGTVLTLLCLQMGSGPEGEEVFRSLKPLLVSVLTDSTASPGARQSCATALGMCCYIAAADLEDLVSCLSCLEGIFSPPSAGEGGSAPTQHGPLHCSALQSWSLLLTICPPSHIKSVLDNRWLKLPPLLSSSSVALRILAGETIALVFELAQDVEEDLCHQDTEFLRAQLKVLATESNKYRAKTDRRKQRSIFRDILRFIESGEYQEETIRFGLECMYLDSWARQRTYQAFKEVLGSGIRHHLQNNELLREIFGLGPPLVLDAAALKASKVSRFEKVGATTQIYAHSPLLRCCGLQPSTCACWVLVGRWTERHPLTHLSFPPLPAPLQLGCLQSPHESPEPGAGQAGGRAVTGGGGQSPQPTWTADPAL